VSSGSISAILEFYITENLKEIQVIILLSDQYEITLSAKGLGYLNIFFKKK
jgi:hypothetical protein